MENAHKEPKVRAGDRSHPPIFLALVFLSGLICWSGRYPPQAADFGVPVGDYPVGYRVDWVSDATRTWSSPDNTGAVKYFPRWVRVHTWYPAVSGTGSAMTFRDYMDPKNPDFVPAAVAGIIHANDLGTTSYGLRGVYKDDPAQFMRAMTASVAARGLAEPAKGKFPVIVYSVGQNDFTQDAASIAEYLASNGFVVTCVPHLGTSQLRSILFAYEPASFETQLRDLEIALSQALKMPLSDEKSVFGIGHSYGGTYALLLGMRGSSLKAVIGLDPAYIAQQPSYAFDIRTFPYFNANLHIPVITLRRGSMDVDRSIVDSLLHSERLEIVYPTLMHSDFTSRAFLRRELPNKFQSEDELKVRDPVLAVRGASHVFRQVLACIHSILSDADLTTSVISDPLVPQRVSQEPAIATPTEEEVYWRYKASGLDAVKRLVGKAVSRNGTRHGFNERTFLTIARELDYAGKHTESIDMFRVITVAFPESPTAQLAAAQALLDSGEQSEARDLFLRVVQLDPTNQAAKNALAKLPK